MVEKEAIIPPDWAWSTLGNSCDIVLGQSPPSDTYNLEGIGLPFYQGKSEFSDLYPIPVKWCSKPQKLAKPNDVLISVRAPVGPTNLCKEDSCIGRGLAAIHPRNSMPSKYFMYYLRLIEKEWDTKATGTTFKAITGTVLRNQRIPLAPLTEQERIVERIESLFTQLDAGITGLKRAKAALKRYKASVLKAACEGRLGNYNMGQDSHIPNNWAWTTLGELKQHLTSGSRGWAKYYSDSGSLFIRVGNFERLSKSIYLEKSVFVNAPQGAEADRTRLKLKDILITMTADVGMVGVVDERTLRGGGAYINQHVGLVRIRETNYVDFIAYALASEVGQTQFRKKQYGLTKVGLNFDDIKSIRIPLPPLEQQRRIVVEVDQRLSVVQELEQTIEANLKRAERLRQAILKRAFEGKLT